MRVLVTGGAGFIGSHYVRSLLSGRFPGVPADDADLRVTVLDALTYAGNPANLAFVAADPRYSFVHGDVRSPSDLDATLPGHDVVVHFAAETHVDRSIGNGATAFVTTNVVGTQTLLEACLRHRVERVVHVSTDEVYGSITEGSWTEDQLLEPNSPYAASKAGSDLIARAYARTYGLDVVITRCSNNYGPYQHPDKLVPLFVTNLLDGEKVPLYGKGAQSRDWLFVDDHCRAVQLVLEAGRPGQIYNIGGGTELTNLELTDRLLAATGRDRSAVEYVPDPRGGGHDMRYSVDSAEVTALGWAPRMECADGLALTVQWYRDNRAWWEPLKATRTG